MGEGGIVFQMGGDLIFKWGEGAPWGASVLMRGFLKKIVGWGGGGGRIPMPPPTPHYGKPASLVAMKFE